MKKLLFILFMFAVTGNVSGQNIIPQYIETLQMQVKACDIDKTIGRTNIPSRVPKKSPTIGYAGHTLYLYGQFEGLTLELVDNGTVVYSTVLQAQADEVTLPDYMSGMYELQLNDGRYLYSCEIDLE